MVDLTPADIGYILREYTPESDESFVYHSMLGALRVTSLMYRDVRDRIFFASFRRIIDQLLARGSEIIVAAEKDSPVIFGYVLFERASVDDRVGIFHWVCVKMNWRRMGIATQLIGATRIDPNRAYFTTRTSYELSLPARQAARKAGRSDWVAVREERIRMAVELESKGKEEGDSRVMIRKWPGLIFNPFLLPSPEIQSRKETNG